MTTRTKWILLGGLLLIWATTLFFGVLEEEDLQQGPLQYKTGQTTRETGLKGSDPSLAFIKATSSDPVTFTQPRNIFAPLGQQRAQKPTPKVSKKPPRKASLKRALGPKPPSSPSPGDLAAQQARQQLARFRFLGYLTKGGESQVFLSNGQAIYIGKQGETLEGDIQIKSIKPTEVILSKPLKNSGTTVEAALPLTQDKGGSS